MKSLIRGLSIFLLLSVALPRPAIADVDVDNRLVVSITLAAAVLIGMAHLSHRMVTIAMRLVPEGDKS